MVGREEARPLSADLLRPPANGTGGLINRLGTVRLARAETALDFRRGGWLEAGSAYATAPKRIDPDHILAQVDVTLGLLDRLGARPANPPTTA